MGNGAFNGLRSSAQALIETLQTTATILEKRIDVCMERASHGDEQAEEDLAQWQQILHKTKAAIPEAEKFSTLLDRDWSPIDNRVIGHVVWLPPLTGLNLPYGYTRDVCVIKLVKDKFLPNFRGNVIDLGAC